MEKLHFTVRIDAPVHTVWSTMLGDATYREWTSAFQEDSYYEGSWDLGTEIRFLGPSEDGSLGGMIATVVEKRPDEFVSLEYVGQVVEGVDDTTSDQAKRIIGAHENYSFSETGGVTVVEVDVDTEEDFAAMLGEAWPIALAKLKEVAEAAS